MKGLTNVFRTTPTRGVRAGRRLAHWHELLEEWCLIHERYCRLVERDAIYWNIERANLAALAAAAWRSGWAALEEFSQEKKAKRSRFSGRADLYLKSPACQDYVESKIVWPGGGTRPMNANSTLRALDSAQNDARAVHLADGAGNRIGVVFAVPYFRRGAQRPMVESLAQFFDGLQYAKLDAVAWCFPPLTEELVWKSTGHSYFLPGVILLAKSAV